MPQAIKDIWSCYWALRMYYLLLPKKPRWIGGKEKGVFKASSKGSGRASNYLEAPLPCQLYRGFCCKRRKKYNETREKEMEIPHLFHSDLLEPDSTYSYQRDQLVFCKGLTFLPVHLGREEK